MSRRLRRAPLVPLGIVVAGAVLLAGCQPSGGSTSPMPTVSPILQTTRSSPSRTPTAPSSSAATTPTPTPTWVVSVKPTTPEQTAALTAEADRVFREYMKLRYSYEAKGGVAGPLPDPLKKYLTGNAAGFVEQILQDQHQAGATYENADRVTFVLVKSQPPTLNGAALISVEFCEDARAVTVVERDGKRFSAGFIAHHAEFAWAQGALRISDFDASEAKSCVG
ncbi:hypothetical protein ACQB6R_02750 [Propionibacteriaceae bacterium G1746]|uniref:hypothetical protein n=1 Tax=Aestuariimicrobium sp. G57 TaxID=3418485 RepID=UPI003C17CA44